MKALVGLLKNRWWWLLIALLLVSLVIWFGGPYLAFADYAPLQSRLARIILIAVVVVLWVFKRALRDIKAAAASSRLVKQVARQEDPSSARAAAAVAQEPHQPLRPAVVHHHRASGSGQDDGARQLGTSLPARAGRQGREARWRRRHAQLRLVVHRSGD